MCWTVGVVVVCAELCWLKDLFPRLIFRGITDLDVILSNVGCVGFAVLGCLCWVFCVGFSVLGLPGFLS